MKVTNLQQEFKRKRRKMTETNPKTKTFLETLTERQEELRQVEQEINRRQISYADSWGVYFSQTVQILLQGGKYSPNDVLHAAIDVTDAVRQRTHEYHEKIRSDAPIDTRLVDLRIALKEEIEDLTMKGELNNGDFNH